MKRLAIVVVIMMGLLVVAYGATLAGPASEMSMARAKPTPRIPNYAYYTKRCWPGCHYDPTAQSEEPHTNLHDFEGGLPEGWSWINEDPDQWTLTAVPGTLRITPQPGSVSGDLQGASNVLVADAPSGHFDVVTRVTFDPTADSQGLIFVQLGDEGVISLGRGFCGEEAAPSCVGSGVYFDGSDLGCSRTSVPTTEETVYLMLRKAGNFYIGYYGLGNKWSVVGRCYHYVQAPSQIGLAAVSTEPNVIELPVDFDLVSVVERP